MALLHGVEDTRQSVDEPKWQTVFRTQPQEPKYLMVSAHTLQEAHPNMWHLMMNMGHFALGCKGMTTCTTRELETAI